MAISSNRYKDLDFLLAKTTSNDFTTLGTDNAIKQSIKNLLMTKIGFNTKFEQPELGSNIFNLLSNKATRFTALQIKDQIKYTLENYEPRISIDKILVDFDKEKGSFIVSIFYTIISLSISDKLVIDLEIVT